jgi:uncharacterized membrane protein (UPF0127 family)
MHSIRSVYVRTLLIALTVGFCLLSGVRVWGEPPIEPLDHLPMGTVSVHGHHPDRTFNVWLANTDARREQGLMYVKSLSPTQGMLFVFDQADVLSFWMKNTYIPLDIIYIGTDHKVVRIIENAAPLSLEPLSSRSRANEVLEIGGGMSQQLGLQIGDRVDFKPAQR